MRFVYGSMDRIFVNTALGCKAKCKYCYLPYMKNKGDINYISTEDVIKLVEEMPYFVKGEKGTIVSIGCYSECLDKKNISKTKAILEYFLPMGNYIQLATKQEITKDIIDIITSNRIFQEQVSIYISMPTISGISKLEKGTGSFQVRVDNITRCIKNGINVALYIKPFLEQLTNGDKDTYINIAKEYDIPVIIGSYLSIKNSASKADVGEELLYEQQQSPLYEEFVSEFDGMCHNYRHSVELIEYFREIRTKTNDRRIYQ